MLLLLLCCVSGYRHSHTAIVDNTEVEGKLVLLSRSFEININKHDILLIICSVVAVPVQVSLYVVFILSYKILFFEHFLFLSNVGWLF